MDGGFGFGAVDGRGLGLELGWVSRRGGAGRRLPFRVAGGGQAETRAGKVGPEFRGGTARDFAFGWVERRGIARGNCAGGIDKGIGGWSGVGGRRGSTDGAGASGDVKNLCLAVGDLRHRQ